MGAVRSALVDVTTVIHLGGISDEAPFTAIREANITGTYHVFEAARHAGVRRIVFASTHHVTGFYPVGEEVDESSPPRPDTLYAASKAFGEMLGRLYHDKWGLEVVCLRLGACSGAPQNAHQMRTWMSMQDCVDLIIRAVTNAVPEGYAVAYGVSDNSRRFWDMGGAHRLGFRPQDSADTFGGRIPDRDDSSSAWQGGFYTDSDYRGRKAGR